MAELGPVTADGKRFSGPGFAKGIMTIIGDILEPIDVEWEALK